MSTTRFGKAKHIISFYNTLIWDRFGYWDSMNQVADNLFLGRLPLNREDTKIIDAIKNSKNGPLKLVVSVVDPYEITEPLLGMDPARKEDWNINGVDHRILKMKDFSDGEGLDIQLAAKIVLEIQDYRERGFSVYIHCKAGRTRSAMLVICLLVLFELQKNPESVGRTLEELIDMAVEYLATMREQIKVHPGVKNSAKKIIIAAQNMLKSRVVVLPSENNEVKFEVKSEINIEFPHDFNILSLQDRVDYLFAQPGFKTKIMGQDACKKLYDYKNKLLSDANIGRPKRASHVEHILVSINEAEDSKWYAGLMKKVTGPVDKLLTAEPCVNVRDQHGDKLYRARLIRDLMHEVEELVCEILHCNKKEFKNIYASSIELKPQSFSL